MIIQAPTPENYAQWVADRNARTALVISKQKKISGKQVLEENLSARMIYDAGYTLNPITDTLEKYNE